MSTARLRVGGLTRLTTIDYPGRLAAVVFCQGCPWRCGYCHNAHLQPGRGAEENSWLQVMDFLRRRRGLLDAVVFSGGEPTLQPGLLAAVREAKELGFRIGLHTAGVYPARLALLLAEVSWVGLDIKAPWALYDAITGVQGSGTRAQHALDLLLASGVDYECRTTWHPGLYSEAKLSALGRDLAARGVKRWVVQPCRPVAPQAIVPPVQTQGAAGRFN